MRKYGSLELVTAPASEPLTLSEAKSYLRVDSSSDDTLITALIVSARTQIENYLNRKLINQTWKYWLDQFPVKDNGLWWDGVKEGHINMLVGDGGEIEIPLAPLSSVTHLKTYDDDDAASTMSSSDYFIDSKGSFGRIVLRQGATWPTTVLRHGNGIEIQFVAGYGASSSSVPAPIIQSMRNLLVSMYDCRGEGGMLSPGSMSMISSYRVIPQ